MFPKIMVRLMSGIHLKCTLIEPTTTIIGSSNFSASNWQEINTIFKSNKIYAKIMTKFMNFWKEAEEVPPAPHQETYINSGGSGNPIKQSYEMNITNTFTN